MQSPSTTNFEVSQRHFARDVKCIFLGDLSVGKTSLINRLVHDEFHSEVVSTIGVSFQRFPILVKQMQFNLQLWDTAGQERFKALVQMYFKNADFAFLVFDLTRANQLTEVKYWHEQIDPATKQIIVGNKSDLQDKVVDHEDVKRFAAENGCLYFETSSKTGANVAAMFDSVLQELPKKSEQTTPSTTLSSEQLLVIKGKSGCC